jgi:cytochrome c-type biogenesis protein
MTLFILSFIAGALTVAAPCILPLLPIIIGGSLSQEKNKQVIRPLIVTASLAISVVIFTLLLKSTTALLNVPQLVWQIVSALIVIALGINFLYPKLWESISSKTKFYTKSNKSLGGTLSKKGTIGAILTGLALGPVFSSCSPTYAFIVATVLPTSFGLGFIYLIAYALGLSSALLLVAYVGQSFIQKLGWLTDPRGWFSKALGILFILVGISVLFGVDKRIQVFVLEKGWYGPIATLEEKLK